LGRTCHHRPVSDDVLTTNAFIAIGLIVAVPLVLWLGRRGHIAGWSLLVRLAFTVYIVVLIGLLFTPMPLPPWIPLTEEGLNSGYRPWPFPWVNIVPFETISGALRHGLDWQPGRVLVGNVLAFAPFGLFLPLIWPRRRSLVSVVAAGLAISLVAETMQVALSVAMGTPYRVADVDDVIINVLGVALGYGLYRSIGLLVPREAAVQPAS
jgi:glycopeptide antibiotics resistance protein